jgi:hypothetical protein
MALHAVALTEPLAIDGRLDEALYRDVAPISDFIQVEPLEGAPATERTELWIAFDRDRVYVSFRCFESEPTRLVAKEMRRDNGGIWSGDDNVAFIFDTFNDKRNGFQFTLNSIGGRQDAQIANERQWGGDWNTIWDFKVARFDGGWTVETAIPFKSLRYRPGDDQGDGTTRAAADLDGRAAARPGRPLRRPQPRGQAVPDLGGDRHARDTGDD